VATLNGAEHLSAAPCSDGLQAAYEPLLRRFVTPYGQPRGRRSALPRDDRWGPENIPALIPEDWYARHFPPLIDVSPILARRTVALRLVQMVAGGSLAEAAHFLGISSGDGSWPRQGGRIYSAAGLVQSEARQQPDPFGFEAGLRSLARELSAPGTPLANYQRRRQALETWSINERTWESLAARLPSISRPQTSDLGDRKRQIASVYVWVRVTFGEPSFAPRPIEAAQPPVGPLPDPNLCCSCVGRSSPGQPSRLHPDSALSHRHARPPAAVNAGHFSPDADSRPKTGCRRLPAGLPAIPLPPRPGRE